MKRYTNEVLSITTGLSVIGATVAILLPGTATLAAIYAVDDATTPPALNPFATGFDGTFTFYAADGLYDISVTRAGRVTILRDVEIVDLIGVKYLIDLIPAGPAANSWPSLAALKSSPLGNRTANLAAPSGSDGGYVNGSFTYQTGDFTGRSDVVKLDGVPLTTGALVRQGAQSIVFMEQSGTVALTAQQKLATLGVSPEGYGAVGNGTEDDTAALQAALDTGLPVRLTTGKRYLVTGRLDWNASNVSLTGGGTIVIGSGWNFAADTDGGGTHMRVLFVNGNNVTLSGVTFDMTNAPQGSAVENGALWVTGSSFLATGCQFVGNPKGTAVWMLASATWSKVTDCTFNECSGAVFAKCWAVTISNNTIINAFDAAIAINGRTCIGAVITGNNIINQKARAIPSMIAVEEGPSNWTIVGNVMTGCSGGGIAALNTLDFTTVQGGVIADNIVDGRRIDGTLQTNAAPSALLSIAGTYIDWIVHDNKLINVPSGNPNSRAAVLAASEGSFHDNIIDGTATAGLSALVSITPAGGDILFKANKSTGAAGVRHVLFSPGNYGGKAATFERSDFRGGSEGVNTMLSAGDISNLRLHVKDTANSTTVSLFNAANILGDRADFLNAGAWSRPHSIGTFTNMYATFIPAVSGALAYQSGDQFFYMMPSDFIGFVRIPGSWKNFGALV